MTENELTNELKEIATSFSTDEFYSPRKDIERYAKLEQLQQAHPDIFDAAVDKLSEGFKQLIRLGIRPLNEQAELE